MKDKQLSIATIAAVGVAVLALPILLFALRASTNTASHAAEIPPGDVNRDGKVTLDDVAIIRTVIATGQYNKDADLNHDGVVDAKDIQEFYNLYSY